MSWEIKQIKSAGQGLKRSTGYPAPVLYLYSAASLVYLIWAVVLVIIPSVAHLTLENGQMTYYRLYLLVLLAGTLPVVLYCVYRVGAFAWYKNTRRIGGCLTLGIVIGFGVYFGGLFLAGVGPQHCLRYDDSLGELPQVSRLTEENCTMRTSKAISGQQVNCAYYLKPVDDETWLPLDPVCVLGDSPAARPQ